MMTALRITVLIPALALGCSQDQAPHVDHFPSAISDLEVGFASQSLVSLSWTTPFTEDGDELETYEIRYSTAVISMESWSSLTQVNVLPPPKDTGTEQELMVFSLTAGTQYQLAVRTIDEHGDISDLSNIVEFATQNSVSDDYFPLEVGRKWFYRMEDGTTQIWTVLSNVNDRAQVRVTDTNYEELLTLTVSRDSTSAGYHHIAAWPSSCEYPSTEGWGPPIKLVDPAVSVGEGWTNVSRVAICAGCGGSCQSSEEMSFEFRVEGFEEITTLAGTFQALMLNDGHSGYVADVGLVKSTNLFPWSNAGVTLTAYPEQAD